jgi:hypothetical protein
LFSEKQTDSIGRITHANVDLTKPKQPMHSEFGRRGCARFDAGVPRSIRRVDEGIHAGSIQSAVPQNYSAKVQRTLNQVRRAACLTEREPQ